MGQIVITARDRDVLIISFLLPLHRVPGSVEPLAYYMRRETHIPGFLCPGISVFIAAVQS